jgi:maleamate amidohydrolase
VLVPAISAADPSPVCSTASDASPRSPASPLSQNAGAARACGASPSAPEPEDFPDFEDHCWRGVVPDEVLEIYRPYRRATRLGRRPALLAIDLYNCVFPDGPLPVRDAVRVDARSCGIHAWEAIAPLRRLFDLARGAGLPVFYTTTESRPEANPSQVKATNRPEGGDPAHDYAIRADFAPRPGDVVIFKERASALFGTPLVAHLTRLGVDCLLVCGESTSGCVRASVVDAYSYGFHVAVVEECTFDRSLLSHRVNLFDLHHKYADVMTLDEVAGHLARVRAAEEVLHRG